MNIPLHTMTRKYLGLFLNKALSKFVKIIDTKSSLDKEEIKNIIIIRPNYRIGNLIFLTPLINELSKGIPNVKIDIIVGMKIAGDVLQGLPNVNKVISIPRNLLLQPINMINFIKDARKKEYDLAINIIESSTSSQIVTSLINSKYKASFYNKNNWTDLTHSIEKKHTYKHFSLEALELLRLLNLEPKEETLLLDIKLKNSEIIVAKQELSHLLEKANLNKDSKVVALFRNARLDKKIQDEWWQEWHEELLKLDQNIVVVDILSPDILSKLNNNCLEYSNKNLRALGAFFQACSIYVSADTGPMHLASASQANTLALFNKTDIQIYGTLGDTNKTIDINEMTPKEVAKASYDYLENSISKNNITGA